MKPYEEIYDQQLYLPSTSKVQAVDSLLQNCDVTWKHLREI